MADRTQYIENIRNSLENFNEESQQIAEQLQNLKSDDLTLQSLIKEIQNIKEKTTSEKHFEHLTKILNDLYEYNVENDVTTQDLSREVDEISQEFMTGTNSLLEDIGSKIGEMTKQNELIVSGISKVGNYFNDIFSPFQEVFGLITGVFSIISGGFGYLIKMPNILRDVRSKLGDMLNFQEKRAKEEDREKPKDKDGFFSEIIPELLGLAGIITGGIMSGVVGFSSAVRKDIRNLYKPFMNIFKNGILTPIRKWFSNQKWITDILNKMKNIKGFDKLSKLTGTIGKLFNSIKGKFTTIVNFAKNLMNNSGMLGRILGGLGGILGRAILPLMIAYEVVRGLITGDTIKDKIIEASAGILSIVTKIPEWILNGLLWAFGFDFRVDFGREEIVKALNNVSDWIYSTVVVPIKDFFSGFSLKETFYKLVDTIKNTINDTLGWISDTFTNVKNKLYNLWSYFSTGQFLDNRLFQYIETGVDNAISWIMKPFKEIKSWIDTFINYFSTPGEEGESVFSKIISDLKNISDNITDWISSIPPYSWIISGINKIKNYFTTPGEEGESIFDKIISDLKNVGAKISAWILSMPPYSWIISGVKKIKNYFTTTNEKDTNSIFTKIINDLTNLKNNFDNWLNDTAPFSWVNSGITKIKDYFNKDKEDGDNIFDKIIESITNISKGINKFIVDMIPSWEKDIKPKLKSVVPDWAEQWVFTDKQKVKETLESPALTGKGVKGRDIQQKLKDEGLINTQVSNVMGVRKSINDVALETLSTTQSKKLLETEQHWDKRTTKALQKMAEEGTNKGSIYTHDIYLENILSKTNELLTNPTISKKDIEVLNVEKTKDIETLTTQITKQKMDEQSKRKDEKDKELTYKKDLLKAINNINNYMTNIDNQMNTTNKNVENNTTENQFPNERIPDEIENLSLFLFNKNWGIT